jgi:hypothetical protein
VVTRTAQAWAFGLVLSSSAADAQSVAYRVSGTIIRDPISDRIYGAHSDTIGFDVEFEADASATIPVPAGLPTNLPNFPAARFSEDGFHLPRSAVKSLSFRLSNGTAKFLLADLIGDPSSPGAVFITGSLSKPTSVHILLASSEDGYFEVGLANCVRTCRLTGGIVMDPAGPFGKITDVTLNVTKPLQ